MARTGNLSRALRGIDWIVVAFTLAMAAWGYGQGLVMGVLSLGGFVAGALVGSRLGPALVAGSAHSSYAPLFALAGGLLVGTVLATGLRVIGARVRGRLGDSHGLADGLGGAALLGCVGLGLAWLAGAAALQTPGTQDIRRDIHRSRILRTLNGALPPSGPLLNALARFDPLPRLNVPTPEVATPSSGIARDEDVRAASMSVVRVLGTACGVGVQGSGWVARNGLVVTNAHVVAGQHDTTIQQRGEGPGDAADAIWFDTRNDLAILRSTATNGLPQLKLARRPDAGTSAAVIGFPENGPLDIGPGRLGETAVVTSEDAYGEGPILRRITAFRGRVRPGNSGGPMVDGRGRVVATVFAAEVGGEEEGGGGFGVPDSIVEDALDDASEPVSTGPCAR